MQHQTKQKFTHFLAHFVLPGLTFVKLDQVLNKKIFSATIMA